MYEPSVSLKYRNKPNNQCPRFEKIRNRFCSASSPSDCRYATFLFYFQLTNFTRKIYWSISEAIGPARVFFHCESEFTTNWIWTFYRFYSGCNRKLWHCVQADRKLPYIMCLSSHFCFSNKAKMLQYVKEIYCDLKINSFAIHLCWTPQNSIIVTIFGIPWEGTEWYFWLEFVVVNVLNQVVILSKFQKKHWVP